MTIAAPALQEQENLTPKQRAFVHEYVKYKNGVRAARAAGYKGNDHTLRQVAYENLTKPDILRALDAYTRPLFKQQWITLDRTLEHIASIAFAPWCDFLKVKEKDGIIVSAKLNLAPKLRMLKILLKMMQLTWKGSGDIQEFISQSQQVHSEKYHENSDEARKELLGYLRRRD